MQIFRDAFEEVCPRTPLPEFKIEFFPFTGLTNNIRLREGKVLVRLSDLMEAAPESVTRALFQILLAKVYRKPIAKQAMIRYRQYTSSGPVTRKAHLIRQVRGRKRIGSAAGRVWDLESIFEDLNLRFFHGLLARPRMAWSRNHARKHLGHYDPAHNAIVVSRALDQPQVPRYVVEYLVYHEMLHLKHPVKLRGSRRRVHSAEFQAEEKLFPHLARAKSFLKHMGGAL